MSNQQPIASPSLPLPEKSVQEEYTWSFIRVAEGVTINVASALLISFAGLLLLTIPSAFILLLQHTFNFFIVSTNILEIVFIIGATIIGLFIIIAAFLYFLFHDKPWTIMLSLVGAMAGMYMDARGIKVHPPEGHKEQEQPKQQAQENQPQQ